MVKKVRDCQLSALISSPSRARSGIGRCASHRRLSGDPPTLCRLVRRWLSGRRLIIGLGTTATLLASYVLFEQMFLIRMITRGDYNLQNYLAPTEIIDWTNAEVSAKAEELTRRAAGVLGYLPMEEQSLLQGLINYMVERTR